MTSQYQRTGKIIPIRSAPKGLPRRCVISLGVGRKVFTDSLLRLEESLRRVGFQGDFLCWSDQLPEGSPAHFDVPFGFKPYCFFSARDMGYEEILWMDSVCVAIRSLDPVFRLIGENGYALFNNNYDQMMGQWCSDIALGVNGITRDEAMEIPEMPCSVIGLSTRSTLATQFLQDWHQIMSDGVTARGTEDPVSSWEEFQSIFWNRNGRISSDPRVRGHRCDQPAAGMAAHRLGMTPYADFLRDIHYKQAPVNRHTAILHHREFGETITSLDEIYHHVFFRLPLIDTPRESASRLLRRLKRPFKRLVPPRGPTP